jgi:hypothetical protein
MHVPTFYRFGLILAAASGILMTVYSALYKMVKKDIDTRRGTYICIIYTNTLSFM